MRTNTLIFMLLICGQLYAQNYCQTQMKFEPAHVEDYVAGAMLIGTFITVDLVAPYVTTNQRALTALGCIAVTTTTRFIIKKIRTRHDRRTYRR